jgi:hypothetical protein
MATNWGMADGRAFTDYRGSKTRQNEANMKLGTDNDSFRELIYSYGTDLIAKKDNKSPMPWAKSKYELSPHMGTAPPGI